MDVEETVEAILDQDAEPIALRMSGQLMLGVVRIYSRKVQYLFDDCKDARERIIMAFRPGAVDLPEDQLRASRAAITLQDRNMDFDMILGDLAFNFQREFRPRGAHVADAADITLPRSRFYAESNRSFSVQPQSESGRDSQEEGMDLGLDMGDETLSLEFMRHNEGSRHSSIASELKMARRAFSKGSERGSERSLSREVAPFELEGSETDGVLGGGGAAAMDVDEPIDLGLDMGFGFDFSGGADVDMADGGAVDDPDRQRRESSRLSTPPPLDDLAADQSSLATITPRTAARISKLIQTREAQTQTDKPPRKKVRVMAVDEEIELQMERGQGGRRDTSAIMGKENFVPANEAIIAMLHVRDDPQAFFLPTIKRGNDTFFVGGLPGMAPQLAELFTFPTNILRRRSDSVNLLEGEDDRRKRLRTGDEEDLEDDEDVEFGRYDGNAALSGRRSRHASKLAEGFEGAMEAGLDGGMDDMQMDFDIGGDDTLGDQLPPRGMTADVQSERGIARAASVAASVAFGDHLDKSDLECPIAIFDSRPAGSFGSLSQSQASASQSAFLDESASAFSRRRSGYSQNTVKAAALLRHELGASEEEDGMAQPGEDWEKELSFQKVSEKGSRRAASSFFFELLVLGTRDNIKIKQDTAYGDITVTAKPALWRSAATEVAA